MSCGWPFHNDINCEECKTWEQKYGENEARWMEQKAEVRAAAKAVRRKTTPHGGTA